MKTLDLSVYEAARTRLRYIFRTFERVYVAFSGGKDSGALLHLALDVAAETAYPHPLGVFHLDYEAQYTMTTDYVDEVYRAVSGTVSRAESRAPHAHPTEPLRCCVPVRCPTSTSMFEQYWRPWEASKRDIWVRDLPEHHLSADDLGFVTPSMTDYDFQRRFSLWYHERHKSSRTCVLIGIRTQESLDRWRTIASDKNINKFEGLPWTSKMHEGVYNAYPIYDWSTEDVWTAHAQEGWSYNRLYDLFSLAGVPLNDQRVASPFHSYAKASLALYRVIDPHMWGKMVSRVNGVNCTALYGGTKLMGWKRITKPRHMTWEQYAHFLLETLPEETAANYRTKLATSITFWRERGGVLSEETIADLRAAGLDIEVGDSTNYRTQKRPVRMAYADDIDTREFSLVPTWKRLCITILKNDHVGKYMGFSLTKQEQARRRTALAKYQNL